MDQQNGPLLSWIQDVELDIPLCLAMIVSIIPSIPLLPWYVYNAGHHHSFIHHHSSQGFVLVAVGGNGWVKSEDVSAKAAVLLSQILKYLFLLFPAVSPLTARRAPIYSFCPPPPTSFIPVLYIVSNLQKSNCHGPIDPFSPTQE